MDTLEAKLNRAARMREIDAIDQRLVTFDTDPVLGTSENGLHTVSFGGRDQTGEPVLGRFAIPTGTDGDDVAKISGDSAATGPRPCSAGSRQATANRSSSRRSPRTNRSWYSSTAGSSRTRWSSS